MWISRLLPPVDSLKIDGSFVVGLGRDSGDEAIVSGTIDLARALRLKVVAEGVETAEQFARLEALGCVLAQGTHFAAAGRRSVEAPGERPQPLVGVDDIRFEIGE